VLPLPLLLLWDHHVCLQQQRQHPRFAAGCCLGALLLLQQLLLLLAVQLSLLPCWCLAWHGPLSLPRTVHSQCMCPWALCRRNWSNNMAQEQQHMMHHLRPVVP
jgi:hypothetical protein